MSFIFIYSITGSDTSIQSDWTTTYHEDQIRDIEYSNGHLYTASDDGQLRKIDPDTGDIIWSFSEHWDEDNAFPLTEIRVRSLTTTENDNIIVGTDKEEIYKLNSDGEELWRYDGHANRLNRSINSIYEIESSNGRVYSVSRVGELHSYSAGKSEEVIEEPDWIYREGDRIEGLAVADTGEVYIGTWSQELREISPEGEINWNYTGFKKGSMSGGVDTVSVDEEGYVYGWNDAGGYTKTHKIDPENAVNGQIEDPVWRFLPDTDLTYYSFRDIKFGEDSIYMPIYTPPFEDGGELHRVDIDRAPSDGSVFNHSTVPIRYSDGVSALELSEEKIFTAQRQDLDITGDGHAKMFAHRKDALKTPE